MDPDRVRSMEHGERGLICLCELAMMHEIGRRRRELGFGRWRRRWLDDSHVWRSKLPWRRPTCCNGFEVEINHAQVGRGPFVCTRTCRIAVALVVEYSAPRCRMVSTILWIIRGLPRDRNRGGPTLLPRLRALGLHEQAIYDRLYCCTSIALRTALHHPRSLEETDVPCFRSVGHLLRTQDQGTLYQK